MVDKSGTYRGLCTSLQHFMWQAAHWIGVQFGKSMGANESTTVSCIRFVQGLVPITMSNYGLESAREAVDLLAIADMIFKMEKDDKDEAVVAGTPIGVTIPDETDFNINELAPLTVPTKEDAISPRLQQTQAQEQGSVERCGIGQRGRGGRGVRRSRGRRGRKVRRGREIR